MREQDVEQAARAASSAQAAHIEVGASDGHMPAVWMRAAMSTQAGNKRADVRAGHMQAAVRADHMLVDRIPAAKAARAAHTEERARDGAEVPSEPEAEHTAPQDAAMSVDGPYAARDPRWTCRQHRA